MTLFVPYTQAERDECYKWAIDNHEVFPRQLDCQKNNDKLTIENVFWKRLSTKCVENLLLYNGIICTNSNISLGFFDLETTKGITLQVRFCRNQKNFVRLMEVKTRADKMIHQYYISIRNVPSKYLMQIMGWCDYEELTENNPRSFGQGVTNYWIFHDDLHDIRTLIVKFSGEEFKKPSVIKQRIENQQNII